MKRCLWLFPFDSRSSNHQPPSDPALCILFPFTNSLHVFFHPINLMSGLPAGLPLATSNLRVLALIYSLHLLCARPNPLSLDSAASTPKHVAVPPTPHHPAVTWWTPLLILSILVLTEERLDIWISATSTSASCPGHHRSSENTLFYTSFLCSLPTLFHPTSNLTAPLSTALLSLSAFFIFLRPPVAQFPPAPVAVHTSIDRTCYRNFKDWFTYWIFIRFIHLMACASSSLELAYREHCYMQFIFECPKVFGY